MFAYVGGPKRPKKSLIAAVSALGDGYEGEKAIYDTETGELFSLDGKPLHTLLPHQYEKLVAVLGLIAATTMTALPLPKKVAAVTLTQIGGKLGEDAGKYASELLQTLKKSMDNGDREPSGS